MKHQPFFNNPEAAIIRSAVKSLKKNINKMRGEKAM